MTLEDGDRKVGINVSVPYKYIEEIDKKAKRLDMKRSNYIWLLIEKDLKINERS